MTDKDARWDKTEHPRHRKVEMEKLGESGGSFNTQIFKYAGGGGQGEGWKGAAEEGEGQQ